MPLTDWGQDWDDWMESRPTYEGDQHQLGYDPEVHQEGKGFVVGNGSVWTWPTESMRPQHLEYSRRAQQQSLPVQPDSAFHIKDGQVYVFGPGRELTPELQDQIGGADPRLTFTDPQAIDIPSIAPSDYGHGNRIVDILNKGKVGRAMFAVNSELYADQRFGWDLTKVADKMNDFLMNPKTRPDLQTPEAQEYLSHLQQYYHNEKTDPLMPWLTREWKKGRMELQGSQGPSLFSKFVGTNGTGERPVTITNRIEPGTLNHWADWYGSNHPTRQGVDLMQLQNHDLSQKVHEWDQDMRAQQGGAADTQGKIEHRWPDDWTLQKLTDRQHLKDEGEKMGHCVGGYAAPVANGQSLIYSLRDNKNEPHATMEIQPNMSQCPEHPEGSVKAVGNGFKCGECGNRAVPTPNRGEMVQVQGRANQAPKPEYQQRIKDWFTNKFDPEDRPTWGDQYISDWQELLGGDHGGYREYHGGDYGLEQPETDYDWDNILDSWHHPSTDWRDTDGDEIAGQAAQDGQLDELDHALEEWKDRAKEHFNDRFDEDWRFNPGQIAEEHGHYIEPDDIAPEPQRGDFEDEHGFVDENAYDEAYDMWETEVQDEREQHLENLKHDVRDDAWYNDARNDSYDQMQGAINHHQRRAHQPSKVVKRKLHRNYLTGEPCACGFTTHLNSLIPLDMDPTESMALSKVGELKCPTCGDPLEHSKCKRCDWAGWSEPVNDEMPEGVLPHNPNPGGGPGGYTASWLFPQEVQLDWKVIPPDRWGTYSA